MFMIFWWNLRIFEEVWTNEMLGNLSFENSLLYMVTSTAA